MSVITPFHSNVFRDFDLADHLHRTDTSTAHRWGQPGAV